MFTIKQTAEISNLRMFKDSLNDFLEDKGIPESKISDIELAVEEFLVNIINYSYPDSTGLIELSSEINNNQLIITIIDEGIPFDPTKSSEPDLESPIHERTEGGMGIYLAKKLLDQIQYKRTYNSNILSLTVNL